MRKTKNPDPSFKNGLKLSMSATKNWKRRDYAPDDRACVTDCEEDSFVNFVNFFRNYKSKQMVKLFFDSKSDLTHKHLRRRECLTRGE
jgi:hypothetical protein